MAAVRSRVGSITSAKGFDWLPSGLPLSASTNRLPVRSPHPIRHLRQPDADIRAVYWRLRTETTLSSTLCSTSFGRLIAWPPGGIIVIDDIGQEGPRQAAIRLLAWNTAWRLYAAGRMYDASAGSAALTRKPQPAVGVLVAPPGIQIATWPTSRASGAPADPDHHAERNRVVGRGHGDGEVELSRTPRSTST
jgi:hypothetical protein